MAFINAVPAIVGKKTGATIKVGVQARRGCKSVLKIFLNKVFVSEYFPGAKAGDKFSVQIGTGDKAGHLMISLLPDGGGNVELRAYGNKSFSLSVLAHGGLSHGKAASMRSDVLTGNDRGVVVRTPHKW